MKRHFPAALASAALLVLSTPAFAAVQLTGHSSLNNVQVSVIDLTPGDGAAAGYEVRPRLQYDYGNTFVAHYSTPTGEDYFRAQPETLVPVHLSVGNDASQAQLHVGSGIGDASYAVGAALPEGHSDAGASGTRALTIVLRANSALTISGYAEGALAATASGRYEQFSAGTSIMAALNYVSVNAPAQLFSRSLTLDAGDGPVSYGEAFSLSAVNDRDYDIELSLILSGSANYSTTLLPVPEPSAWLMLGAGLLAVAGRHRAGRRSR